MKRLLIVSLITGMLFGVFTSPAMAYETADFPDVPQEYWAYDDIMAGADLDIVQGYATGLYAPLAPVSVGEILAMVGRALYPDDCEEAETAVWWKTYYDNAVDKGFVTVDEYTDTAEAMGAYISREEAARIIVRADEIINENPPVVAVLKAIPDWSDISIEFQYFATQAFCKEILSGRPCGFAGRERLSRAEAATVIARLLRAPLRPASDQVQDETWREDAPIFMQEIANELENKGWKRLELIEGEADSVTRWGIFLDTTYEDETLCTIIGQTDGLYGNSISAVVIITFDEESHAWQREEVYYISESGRYWGGIQLHYDEILAADSQELYDYMYSY